MKQLLITTSLFFSLHSFAQTQLETLRQTVKKDIRLGQYEQVFSMLENNIASIDNDTTGLFDALISLGLFQQQWTAILNAYTNHHYKTGEDTTTLSLARFYSENPTEKIVFPQAFNIPFKRSMTGTPVITVKLNNKTYHFWFDTGAGMTVLSSETAAACGIKTANVKTGSATAATGKAVGILPALIDSLEINTLKVYNHPCIILNKKDLEFKLLGIRIIKIDVIIGWNLLQELDVTINNPKKIISLASSDEQVSSKNNFFWLDQPVISCTDSAGSDLLFFMDTGAGGSGVYPPFLSKADTTKAKKKTISIGSAGGIVKMKSLIFPQVKLNVGGSSIVIKKVPLWPHKTFNLFACDGVLGISEFKKRSIHFNVRKGFFIVTD